MSILGGVAWACKGLASLQVLRVVTRSGPDLSMPSSVTLLTALTRLELSSCRYSLRALRHMSQLQELSFQDLNYRLQIPETLTGMASLTSLYINHTELGENVRALSGLSKLRVLHAACISVQTRGDDAKLCQAIGCLTALTALHLPDAVIELHLSALSNLHSLVVLDLCGIKFQGTVDVLSNLTALTMLDMSFNGLASFECCPRWSQLQHLNLRGNNLSCRPGSLSYLTALSKLNMSCQSRNDSAQQAACLHSAKPLS